MTALSLGVTQARAQQAQTPTTSADTQISEVIVTATRRAEPLQKVPLSVVAVTGTQIEQSGALTLSDVGFAAANVVTGEGVSPAQFEGVVIRGIQNRAGVYVDDVLVPTTQAQNVSLSDVDRVEILRGPQGTAFGANTLAGAINTITKQPSFKWTGDVSASYGNYNYVDTRAYISGPLVPDLLAFKASAFRTTRDGYDEDTSGRKLPTIDVEGVRGGLLFTPTPKLSILLSGDWGRDDPIIDDYHPLVAGTNSYTSAAATYNFADTDKRDIYGGQLRINYDFGNGIKLVSITADRYLKNYAVHDQDFSPANALVGIEPIHDHDVSEEVRLTGGGKIFDWLLGGYYFDETRINQTHFVVGPDYPVGGGATLGTTISNAVYDQLKTRNEALFGTVNWRFAPKWTLSLGLRYSDDRIEDSNATTGYSPAPVLGPLTKLPTISDNRFDSSVSLSYNFARDVMAYGRVATGYHTAGYNASLCTAGTAAQQQYCKYAPETLISYEVGLKSFFFDKRLMANVAIFDEEYKNLQRQEYIGSLTSPYFYGNAARARASGVEFEMQARATTQLSFDASVGYDDTHYISFPAATVFDFGGNTLNVNLSGKDLPFAPHYTGTGGVNYTGRTNYGKYTLRAEVQYRGTYVDSDSPVELYDIKAQTNVNLSAEFAFDSGIYVAARGRNVTDVRTVTNVSGGLSAGQYFATISAPAIGWVEVGYRF